jgi:regulator of protease activity HflC (stomatin/prohibitin superfamily)
LNSLIKGSLQEASEPWGLEIRRYEITEITPDAQIRIAMDKQAAAERGAFALGCVAYSFVQLLALFSISPLRGIF